MSRFLSCKTRIGVWGISLGLLLAACGGGGGGGSTSSNTLSGAVIDGYIEGAKVCLDINANLACDTGEPSTTTNAAGKYTIAYSGSTAGLHVIAEVGENAKDIDDGGKTIKEAGKAAFTLATPATKPQALTPLTTLVAHEMMENKGLSAEEAEKSVKAAHSITENLLGHDYVAASKPDLHKAAKILTLALSEVASAAGIPRDQLTPEARKQIMAQAKEFAADFIKEGKADSLNNFRTEFGAKKEEISGKIKVVNNQGDLSTVLAKDVLASGLVIATKQGDDLFASIKSVKNNNVLFGEHQLLSGAGLWSELPTDSSSSASWVLGTKGWIQTKSKPPTFEDFVFNGNCVSLKDVEANQGVTAFEQYCFQQKPLLGEPFGKYFPEFKGSQQTFPAGAFAFNVTEGVSDDKYELFPDAIFFASDIPFDDVLSAARNRLIDISAMGCSVKSHKSENKLIWSNCELRGETKPDLTQTTAFEIREVNGVTILVIDIPRVYWLNKQRDMELGVKLILAKNPGESTTLSGFFTPKTFKTNLYFGGDRKISNLVAFNAVMKAANRPELQPELNP